MIARYTLPEMEKIWSEENRFQKMLDIEIVVCEAYASKGIIPKSAVRNIKSRAKFSVNRINAIEKTVNHDVIAFLTNVAENVGKDSRFIHVGMTSSDILDTALSLLMREAMGVIITTLKQYEKEILKKAKKYKYTIMMGRTHGVHAEPITFGLKMLIWLEETRRNIKRLESARENISVGKISGAVGNFANIDPWVEEYVCRKMGLKPASVSTQIIQRDRHAEYLSALAITASSLEKFATEIRNLQRTEIRELEEPFRKGQKGSSAMPHKRNPITCERICGIARIIRSNSLAGMENVALWHERDITHSSVERIIIPDSATALHYIIQKFIGVLSDLNVYEDNMKENIGRSYNLIFSQKVLLALVKKGLTRESAYRIVQDDAMKAFNEKTDFKKLIKDDGRINDMLNGKDLENCFSMDSYLKNVDKIYKRCGVN